MNGEQIIAPIGPATPAPVTVAELPVFYKSLTKDRYGDYTLTLGLAKEYKDEAWKLTDHDGMMLNVRIEVIPRIIPPVLTSPTSPTELSHEWNLE